MKPRSPKPTAAEWEILQILWDRGPSTVRQVHETLEARRPGQYTTALKLLQIMADKGLVKRDETERAHVYRAAVERETAEARMVDDLVDRVFAGSAAQLVQRALSRRSASREDVAEIRRLIEQYEKERL
jgi:BlaI family penicillinase repressor